MKRDDEYLRKLLIQLEAQEDWLIAVPVAIGASGEDRKRLGHLNLLCDAGLVVQVGLGTYRITAQGHDYLEAIRDEGVWTKTKAVVAETGGNATIEIFKSLATGFLKKKISEQTGIEL